MKKSTLLMAILGLSALQLAYAGSKDAVVPQSTTVSQKASLDDPFDDDPFFESQSSMLREMEKLQHAMKAMMNSQFAQLHHNLSGDPQIRSMQATNVEVQESKDKLIYKMKLPSSADKNVDVSVKEGKLVITSKVMQKITKQNVNGKSISYSQSSNSQSFQLPKGFDEKSLSTKLKGDNLLITLTKAKA